MNDPRVVGGKYRSGYWRDEYVVTAMWTQMSGRTLWMSVEWSDGRSTQHCTAWDSRRDAVVGVADMQRVCEHCGDAPVAVTVSAIAPAGSVPVGDLRARVCLSCVQVLGRMPSAAGWTFSPVAS